MTAPTHILLGLLTTTGAFAMASTPVHRDLPALLGALVGSLLPDIDNPNTFAGHLVRPLAAHLEHRHGHRRLTHSLLAAAVLALLLLPLRGLLPTLYWAFLTAYLSHLLADCFTVTGADLFYPYPGPCVIPANPRCRLEAGSPAEQGLRLLLVLLLLLAWPLSLLGGTWRAMRYVLATQATAYTDYQTTTTQALLDFRGRWRATHEPVRGLAPILDGDARGFVIAWQGQALRYADDGDIVPGRTRVLCTDQPLRRDTLDVHAQPWPEVLQRLPLTAWVSGRLTAACAFIDSAVDPLAPTRHTPLRVDGPHLDLAFAALADLRRFAPAPAVDPDRLADLQRQLQAADLELLLLQLRRPPVHYLQVRLAQVTRDQLAARRDALAAAAVRFSGQLILRHLDPPPAAPPPTAESTP